MMLIPALIATVAALFATVIVREGKALILLWGVAAMFWVDCVIAVEILT